MRMYTRMLVVLSVMAGSAMLPSCGGDESKPPGSANGESDGSEGEGSPDGGEGEGASVEGEGEGDAGEGEGEGSPPAIPDCMCDNVCTEVDDPIPDPEYSDDGLECPQDFAGTWWLEISDIDVHGYPRNPAEEGSVSRQFWASQEITLEQENCFLYGRRPERINPMSANVGRGIIYPPSGFCCTRAVRTLPLYEWITWTGAISDDQHAITGTCNGNYPDVSKEPPVPIPMTCSFVMTRR